MNYNKDLSIVISIFNEEESLPELVSWIEQVMTSEGYSYEVIMVDDFDEPAKFSSYGTYHGIFRPDVYAKGVRVKGVDAFGTYSFMSGTSVSAPYVAGVCCLLHEKYKNLNPYQVKRLILSMSKSKGNMKILKV